MAEGVGDVGVSPVWIGNETDGWFKTSYRPAEEFNVTDVDIDPLTGDLIVLERAFSRMKGPRARLARVAASSLDQDLLVGRELTHLTFLQGVDNMEGIDVERNADGALIAHIMSDDNFNDIQRTVLIGISIDETPACLP